MQKKQQEEAQAAQEAKIAGLEDLAAADEEDGSIHSSGGSSDGEAAAAGSPKNDQSGGEMATGSPKNDQSDRSSRAKGSTTVLPDVQPADGVGAAAPAAAAAPESSWFKRLFARMQKARDPPRVSPPAGLASLSQWQREHHESSSPVVGKELPQLPDTPAALMASQPPTAAVPDPENPLGDKLWGRTDDSGLLPVWSPPMGPQPLPPIGGGGFSRSPAALPGTEIEASDGGDSGPVLPTREGLGGRNITRLPPINSAEAGFGGSSGVAGKRPMDSNSYGPRAGESDRDKAALDDAAEMLEECVLHDDAMLAGGAKGFTVSPGPSDSAAWCKTPQSSGEPLQPPRGSSSGSRQQGSGSGGTINGGTISSWRRQGDGPSGGTISGGMVSGPLAKAPPPGVMGSEQSMTNMLLTAAAVKAADLQGSGGGGGGGGGGLTASSRLGRPPLSAIMQDGDEQLRLSPGGVSGWREGPRGGKGGDR